MASPTGKEPPTWAVAAVVASIAVVSLLFTVGKWLGVSALPFGNSDYFWIGLIFLPMVTLLAAAIIAKLIETRGVMPTDVKKGCAVLLALGIVLAGGGYLLVTQGPAFILAYFPKSQPEAVIFAACFGTFALMIFIAAHRRSKEAQSWPFVKGSVLASSVESYVSVTDGRRTTLYRPVVEFTYDVQGKTYRSKQIKLGVEVSGNESYAQGICAKYPAGAGVEVHYDPANPAEAALENPTGMTWIVAGVGVAALGVAIYALGIFG
jgi:hypothetical protein